jgi:hypothetical protein
MSRRSIACPLGTTCDKNSKESGQVNRETDFVNFMETVISRVDERGAYTSAVERGGSCATIIGARIELLVESLEQELVDLEATPARLVAQRAMYLRTHKQQSLRLRWWCDHVNAW